MSAAFVLALVSALAHAVWNALAKHAAPGPNGSRASTLAVLCLALTSAALVRPWLTGALPPAAFPWVALAGVGEALYVFSLGHAYSRGDLSLTYSVSRAWALVCIWPLSWLAFSTRPGSLALAATGLVASGILLARQPASSSRWHVGWTLVTGAAVGVYHTGYKGAVTAGADPFSAFIAALLVALPLLLVSVGSDVRGVLPSVLRRPRLWLAGLLCAASFLLMLMALQTSESGRVLGLRNASVGFALVLALVRGERPTLRQWAGLLVMVTGVIAFGWAS